MAGNRKRENRKEKKRGREREREIERERVRPISFSSFFFLPPSLPPSLPFLQCLHSLTSLSLDPLAAPPPAGAQSTANTSSAWPGRSTAILHLPSAVAAPESQTLSVESLEPDSSSRESGAHASAYTAPTCPRSVARYLPVSPHQSRTDLSNDAVASFLPSGENETAVTGAEWPVRRAKGLEEACGCQRMTVKSSEAEARTSGRRGEEGEELDPPPLAAR